tara:strand:+ start:230 stop:571 length:342 start_codon:yes stop_codon:yes gene_type:complete
MSKGSKELGGTSQELEAAKTSKAKQELTTAQLKREIQAHKGIGSTLKNNILDEAKRLGIKTKIGLQRLLTEYLKYSTKVDTAVNKKLFNKNAHGGKIKKYARGGGVRKAARYN